jgi:hypothetical protein
MNSTFSCGAAKHHPLRVFRRAELDAPYVQAYAAANKFRRDNETVPNQPLDEQRNSYKAVNHEKIFLFGFVGSVNG